LVVRPTDGEAQLLLGTLLRRVGRLPEARTALEKLARSDAGAPWRSAISRELGRIDSPTILSIDDGVPTAAPAERAA